MDTNLARTAWVLAALATAALSLRADATVLCVRRNSAGDPGEGATVKIRALCRDNEVALDPASIGLTPRIGAVTARTGNVITTNGTLSTIASCEPGEVATGGGVLATGGNGGVAVMRSSRPDPDGPGSTPTGWRVTVANGSPGTGTVTATAYAVCAQQ